MLLTFLTNRPTEAFGVFRRRLQPQYFALGLLSAEKPPVALNSDNLQMATEKHYEMTRSLAYSTTVQATQS